MTDYITCPALGGLRHLAVCALKCPIRGGNKRCGAFQMVDTSRVSTIVSALHVKRGTSVHTNRKECMPKTWLFIPDDIIENSISVVSDIAALPKGRAYPLLDSKPQITGNSDDDDSIPSVAAPTTPTPPPYGRAKISEEGDTKAPADSGPKKRRSRSKKAKPPQPVVPKEAPVSVGKRFLPKRRKKARKED